MNRNAATTQSNAATASEAVQQPLFDNPCPTTVFEPASGPNGEMALSVSQLIRRFPGTRLVNVFDRPVEASQPRKDATMATTQPRKATAQPAPFDAPDELPEQEGGFTVQFQLGDAKGQLILVKPYDTTTIPTQVPKMVNSKQMMVQVERSVTLVELITAETSPPIHYDRVVVFWIGMQKQLESKIGADRWLAGRLQQGTDQNERAWWMEKAKPSDNPVLMAALENAVLFSDVENEPF